MHIAFWSPAWPLEKFQNGIITYVHWMKYALENQGHRVSVFTPSNIDHSDENLRDERLYTVRLRLLDRARRRVSNIFRPAEYGAFQFGSTIAAAIKRVHRSDPIDLFEMEESFGWFAGIQRRVPFPVLVKLHGPAFLSLVEEEIDTPFGRDKIEREGHALKQASTIISPSKLTLSQTIERYGLKPAHQELIVNPIAGKRDTPIWRLDSCDRNVILYVGRFDLRKGADVLLKAFRIVLDDRPDLRLIFVGPDYGVRTPDGKRVGFEEYLRMLYPPELRGQVEFRGSLPNREIQILRTKAMMTIVASRWENQGYAVLEAMIQGCPVVCTDAGGCPESVADGVSGLLAKSGDANKFAERISEMLATPEAAAAMGDAARRHVLEQHSVANVAEKSMSLYERLTRSN